MDAAGLIITPEAPARRNGARWGHGEPASRHECSPQTDPKATITTSSPPWQLRRAPPSSQAGGIHRAYTDSLPRRIGDKATFAAVNVMPKLSFVHDDAATRSIPHPDGHPYVLRARGVACAQ